MTSSLRGAFLEDLTWPEAKAWFDRDPVIVIGSARSPRSMAIICR